MEKRTSQVWALQISEVKSNSTPVLLKGLRVNWTNALFEVIDMRSFSSLWYWIGLAVIWSSMSRWVLGVPYDLITRAKRQGLGGQAELDLQYLVRVNVNRILYIAQISGVWLLGLYCFFISSLVILAFWYDIELAQAVLFIAFPLSVVGAISLSTARLIAQSDAQGEALQKLLTRHRIYVQLVGMIAIFVTAMWGMLHNLTASIL
jgi:hypothetical protein